MRIHSTAEYTATISRLVNVALCCSLLFERVGRISERITQRHVICFSLKQIMIYKQRFVWLCKRSHGQYADIAALCSSLSFSFVHFSHFTRFYALCHIHFTRDGLPLCITFHIFDIQSPVIKSTFLSLCLYHLSHSVSGHLHAWQMISKFRIFQTTCAHILKPNMNSSAQSSRLSVFSRAQNSS